MHTPPAAIIRVSQLRQSAIPRMATTPPQAMPIVALNCSHHSLLVARYSTCHLRSTVQTTHALPPKVSGMDELSKASIWPRKPTYAENRTFIRPIRELRRSSSCRSSLQTDHSGWHGTNDLTPSCSAGAKHSTSFSSLLPPLWMILEDASVPSTEKKTTAYGLLSCRQCFVH